VQISDLSSISAEQSGPVFWPTLYVSFVSYLLSNCNYLRRRLASESIVWLSVTLSRCVCVRRAAYITYRLHLSLVSAAKVMRCIQCLVVFLNVFYCTVLYRTARETDGQML